MGRALKTQEIPTETCPETGVRTPNRPDTPHPSRNTAANPLQNNWLPW